MLELAAFLGNTGSKYSRTRHNAGFLLAEKLPFYAALSWQKKFKGLYTVIDRDSLVAEPSPDAPPRDIEPAPRFHFIKPETYMNHSGEAVSVAAGFFKIKSESIIVVHDELELPLGTISLKFSGGLGGHNGLRSMKACFGTADFWRIRIGIGRPDNRLPGEGGSPRAGGGDGIVDWVLSDFDAAEAETINRSLETGAELLLRAFLNGPETLLPEWAKKTVR